MTSGSEQYVPEALQAVSGSSAPDDRLLWDRYAARGDHAAFAALVARYGPMVLGVCRRVLRREQDAEDAFQAAFLVLALKARARAWPGLLGHWLYGVAYRTALKARSRASARREAPVQELPAPEPAGGELEADVRAVLDEELNRLPAKYRTPLVLCYLEGKSTLDAARALGCPKGTVLSRLARGRDRLRQRLVRRGFVLTGMTLAAFLSNSSARAAVGPALLEGAVRDAALGIGGASIGTRSLAGYALRSLARERLLHRAVTGLAAVAALTGLTLVYRALPVRGPGAVAQQISRDEDRLQGSWKVVSGRLNGDGLRQDQIPLDRLTFRGGQAVFEGKGLKGLPRTASFRLDMTTTPKAIDMTFLDDDPRKVQKAVYTVDYDVLTLCKPWAPDGARPNVLASKPDSGLLLLTFRRERY
jgi:RNA polymerase sigma factor (sigma-70 family)